MEFSMSIEESEGFGYLESSEWEYSGCHVETQRENVLSERKL